MSMPVTKKMRKARQEQAKQRQEEYNKLTIAQKLERLPPAPACKKQRAKLEKLLSEK